MARYKVQKLVTLKGRTNIGRVWETVGPRRGFGRIAAAERVQYNTMLDTNTEVRIIEVNAPVVRERAVW